MSFTHDQLTKKDRTVKDAVAMANRLIQDRYALPSIKEELTKGLDLDDDITQAEAATMAEDLVQRSVMNPRDLVLPKAEEETPGEAPAPSPAPSPAPAPSPPAGGEPEDP